MHRDPVRDLRTYVRHLIREGGGRKDLGVLSAGLGAIVVGDENDGYVDTVVYDVEALREFFLDDPETARNLGHVDREVLKDEVGDTVLGYVKIVPLGDRLRCWDAWQVAMSVGPGLGDLVYACAFATSPKGRLISDRVSMTPSSKGWWRKAPGAGRGMLPLDDVDDPRTPEPDDDCALREEDYLNYAYEAMGDEKEVLGAMKERHEALKADLIAAGGALGEYGERRLRNDLLTMGRKYFKVKTRDSVYT